MIRPTTPTNDPLVCQVQLSRGLVALIDAVDAGWVGKNNWCARADGYAVRKIKGRMQRLHHAVLAARGIEIPPGCECDHINGIRTDNRFSNLRICTHNQNRKNTGLYKNNKLGIRGVRKRPNGKYIAYISAGSQYLGSFATKEEAQAHRLAAELTIYGEFACQGNR